MTEEATLLIVDDTPANLGVVVDSLEERGLRILVAQDGEEGLQRAAYARPDLILLDVMMPGIDGFEVCRRLKREAATRDIPVIFMTALADTASKIAGFAAGAVDYVTKPLETEEVLWRVNTHLALRAMRARVEAQNAELEQSYRDLAQSEERYRLLVEQSPEAILIEAGGRIAFANGAALRLFGANRTEELLGRSLVALVAPACREAAAAAIAALAVDGSCHTLEEEALRLDGTSVAVAATRCGFIHRGEAAVQMVARDVSEHRRLADQLRHRATHDALTGLPNRELLLDRLNQVIGRARRRSERFALGFMDLDRFKAINDTFGHEAGDALLKTAAARMSACLRQSDTLARLGGDEFVLLLPEAGSAEEAMPVLRRMSAALAAPVSLAGHEVSVTCSVGVSIWPQDGEGADALLRSADTAMYRAKQSGRDDLPSVDAAPAGQTAERTLLILDDEPAVTAALARLLRNEGYRLLIAHRAEEAFALLARHAVGVVLSDQRMPDGSGVEFLGQVKRLYPRTVRLILSGHRDFDAAAAAINSGAVHRFLLKPWDDEELRRLLAEAFEASLR